MIEDAVIYKIMIEELIEKYDGIRKTAIKDMCLGYTAEETAAKQKLAVSVVEEYWKSFRRDVEEIIS